MESLIIHIYFLAEKEGKKIIIYFSSNDVYYNVCIFKKISKSSGKTFIGFKL